MKPLPDGLVIDEITFPCPVQISGRFLGEPFYFKARGNRWSLGVGGRDPAIKPGWHYEESYGEESFAAGWMSQFEAMDFLARAVELKASGHPGVARGSALSARLTEIAWSAA